MSPQPWVILDRDGVINHDSPDYIKSPDEWLPIDGSLEAIGRLQAAGFGVAIATNQSGIGRGLYDEATLAAMHAKMNHLLEAFGRPIEIIAHCPHLPGQGCDCRKPKPGLLRQIAQRTGCNLARTAFVGDSYKDLECAIAAGSAPLLVLTGKGRETAEALRVKAPDWTGQVRQYADLAAAVDAIVQSQ